MIPASVFGLLQERERLLDEGRVDRCVVTPLVAGTGAWTRGSSESGAHTRPGQSRALHTLGRLRPAQTVASANADLTGVASHIREQNTATNAKRGLRAMWLDEWRPRHSLSWSRAPTRLVLTDAIGRQPNSKIRSTRCKCPSQLVIVVVVRAIVWWALPGALLGFLFAAATLAAVRCGASGGSRPGRERGVWPGGHCRGSGTDASRRPRCRRRRCVDIAAAQYS